MNRSPFGTLSGSTMSVDHNLTIVQYLFKVWIWAFFRLTASTLFVTGVATEGIASAASPAVDANQLQAFAVVGLVTTASQTDQIELGNQDHRALLIGELRKLGYPAQDVTSNTEAPSRALLSLGGTINEVDCQNGRTWRCNIAIRWEIKDRRDQRVLYRVTTRGREASYKIDEMVSKLLLAALRSLVGRAKFNETLRGSAVRTTTNGSSFDAGFRECPQMPVPMPESAQSVLSATVLIESGEAAASYLRMVTFSLRTM